MNEGAFFAVEPIHTDWQGIFSMESLIFSLIFTIIIFAIFLIFEKFFHFFLKRNIKTKNTTLSKPHFEYTFPEISDMYFLEKNFYLLQKFVTKKYLPKNALAHSYSDIAKYCNNEKILIFYKNLENSIFSQKSLSENEKAYILQNLKNLIANNSK